MRACAAAGDGAKERSHILILNRASVVGSPVMTPVRKIVLLTSDLQRLGGVEAHVAALASGLQGRGYDVTVVAGRTSGETTFTGPTVVIDGIGARNVPGKSLTDLGLLLRRLLPDVLHAHAVFDPLMLDSVQRLVPLLRSVHTYTGCFSSGLKYFAPGRECHRAQGPLCVPHALFRNCGHRKIPRAPLRAYRLGLRGLQSLRDADGVLAYSEYMMRDLQVNRIPKLSLAPLFVPHASLLPPPAGRSRVLFVGRLVPAKGVDTLITAVAHTEAHLDVHGEGRAESRLKRLARSLGVEDRVVFHGWSNAQNLESAYATATVVAMPSIWPEPFGLVGLEAMMRGRAVLASRTGGIPEWLLDGETGQLAPPGDARAWTEALRTMLADPDRCHRLGKSGRQRVLEHFTLERHLASLLPAYTRARTHWQPNHT
jgi:glycosyltransferase involved in cell wall biosynthesis